MVDRIEPTATVWMCLAVGCARCHDHKFDPISQREYFQLFAFFNHGPETSLVTRDDPPPPPDVATPEERAEMETRRRAESKLNQLAEPLRLVMASWEKSSAAELATLNDQLAAHVAFEPGLAIAGDVKSRAAEKGGNVTYEPGLLGHAASFDAMQHIELPADLAMETDQPWSIGLWMKPTGSLNCELAKIEPTGQRRGFELIWLM